MPFDNEGFVDRPNPVAEQLDCRTVWFQRRHTEHTFTAYPERFTTGDEELKVGASSDHLLDERADLGDEVFTVVDDEEQAPRDDPIDDSVQQQLVAAGDDRQC